ncbi:MAG: hypothetical protein P1V97_25415, partial [Planctomycetota bacterium]|nr:hypothetical protein [Planctomycetota bacterium]
KPKTTIITVPPNAHRSDSRSSQSPKSQRPNNPSLLNTRSQVRANITGVNPIKTNTALPNIDNNAKETANSNSTRPNILRINPDTKEQTPTIELINNDRINDRVNASSNINRNPTTPALAPNIFNSTPIIRPTNLALLSFISQTRKTRTNRKSSKQRL